MCMCIQTVQLRAGNQCHCCVYAAEYKNLVDKNFDWPP